jgi:hypothetical protein
MWYWDSMGVKIPFSVRAVEQGKSFDLVCGPASLQVRLVGGVGARTGLRLVNTGLPEDDDGFQSTRSGWLLAGALLRKYLTEYWDRPKQTVFVHREAQVDFARLIDLYRLPRREEWLGGAPPVLEDSGTEVALDWAERQGVLELKAFAAEGKKFVGMRATSWDGGSMDMWPGAINEALDRLLPLIS